MPAELVKQERGEMQVATPMQMIQSAFAAAIQQGAALEVVDRILKAQKEMMDHQEVTAFNDSLARIQAKIKRVMPDSDNPQTRSKYASFAALDRVVRPLYVAEGMALSFDTAEIDKPDMVRVVCDASLGGYTRRFHIDMPADGKGAKGGDVMTRTHATGSAVQYGKRYLELMIFNIAIGKDDDGNAAGGDAMPESTLDEWLDAMRQADTRDQLQRIYTDAFKAAKAISDRDAMAELTRVKDDRKAVLRG